MKKVLFFILILISSFINAQEVDSLFAKANKLYTEGFYEEAIDGYVDIVEQGYQSEELYYNLANSYYKKGEIAPSILYFKRALKLNPGMEDAIFNLELAQTKIVDKIEKVPEGFVVKIWNWLSKLFSVENWAYTAVVLSFLSAILFFIYIFSTRSSVKRLSFVLAFSVLGIIILSVVISHQQNSWQENNRAAVVMSENSYVKLAPNQSAEDSFILHEGTSVLVVDEIGDWKRIKLSDGKMGWISSADITFV